MHLRLKKKQKKNRGMSDLSLIILQSDKFYCTLSKFKPSVPRNMLQLYIGLFFSLHQPYS